MSTTIEEDLKKIILNDFTEDSIITFNNMKHNDDPMSILMRIDQNKGIDLYGPFKYFSSFNNKLHCLIDGAYSMILNYPETLIQPYDLKYKIFVSLDTNIVSYIDRYKYGILKSRKKLTKEDLLVKDVIKCMKKREVQFDFFPYILENTMKGNYNRDIIIRTIGKFNYHNRRYLFKRMSSYILEATKTFTFYEKYALSRLDYYQYFYKSIKVVLLAIAYTDKTIKSIDLKKKTIIDFFDKELNKFLIPEMRMALDYFEDNQSVKFLGKIKTTHKLMQNIENLTWDIFHLRGLESLFRFDTHPDNNIIPYFLSNDEKLMNVAKYFKLAGIGFSKLGRDIYPIVKEELNDDINEYFLPDKVNERFARSKKTNLDLLIKQYTEMLNKLS